MLTKKTIQVSKSGERACVGASDGKHARTLRPRAALADRGNLKGN